MIQYLVSSNISGTIAMTGDVLFTEPKRLAEEKCVVRRANKWIDGETKGR